MIQIAICDDEQSNLELLNRYIKTGFGSHTDDFKIQCFCTGTDLLEANQCTPFDVLFLDIDMPEVSGFDVAKSFRNAFSDCFIIFVTSYSDLVYKSLDFQPFHFIRKQPVNMLEESISEVIEKLMLHMKQNEKLTLEDENSGRVALYYRNIQYIKSEGHYLYYFLQNRNVPIRIRGTLGTIEKEYEKFDIVRCHRSYLINLRFVQRMDMKAGAVYIDRNETNKRISISLSYKEHVDAHYTRYLRSMV